MSFPRLKFKIPKLASDSLYVISSQGITFLTGGLWGILLARWLGAEYLGIYLYYAGIFAIVASIGELGVTGYLMRELNISESPKELYLQFVSKQFLIYFVLALFSAFFLFFQKLSIDYFILGISTVIFVYSDSFVNVLNTWFYANGEAPFVSKLAVGKSALTLLTGYIFYLLKLPDYFLVLAPALWSFIRLVSIILYLIKSYKFHFSDLISFNLSINIYKEVIAKTWVFASMTILSTINSNTNPLVLKYLGFKPYDFGIIGAASRFKNIINLAGGAILNVIFPKMSKDFAISDNKFSETLLKIFKPLFFFNMLVVMFLIFYSGYIINLLLGTEYNETIRFMIWFSVGSITPLLMLLSSGVIAVGKIKLTLIYSAILYALSPIIKIVFIPIFGNIFIGWYEAVIPWLNFIILMVFLRKYFIKYINFKNILIFSLFLLSSVIIPKLVIDYKLNIFIFSFLCFLFISFLGLKFRLVKFRK